MQSRDRTGSVDPGRGTKHTMKEASSDKGGKFRRGFKGVLQKWPTYTIGWRR